MLTIEIINDQTGTNESANYRYAVSVNFREIARGEVKGHNRVDEWWKLAELIAQHGAQQPPKVNQKKLTFREFLGALWWGC